MKLDFVLTFLEVFIVALRLTFPIWLPMIFAILGLGAWVARNERWPIFDGLYFGMITATTVGYGDLRPGKRLSKAVAIVIALIGLLLTGIVVSIGLKAVTISFEQHFDTEEIRCQMSEQDEHCRHTGKTPTT